MFIRTPVDLGAIVRDRRQRLKLDQASFAKRVGVGRQWVIEIERGHARAELGLVLRALDALNLRIDVEADQTASYHPRRAIDLDIIDIDSIVANAKKLDHDK